MKAKSAILICTLQTALFAFNTESLASSGNPIQQLAWKPQTEVLQYHSCGAADACWVAQVKNKRTDKQIAVLRCDGEKLIFSEGRKPESVLAADCGRFEQGDKFQQIPAALRALLHRRMR